MKQFLHLICFILFIDIYIDRKFLLIVLHFYQALISLICNIHRSHSFPNMTFSFGIHRTIDRAIVSFSEVLRI